MIDEILIRKANNGYILMITNDDLEIDKSKLLVFKTLRDVFTEISALFGVVSRSDVRDLSDSDVGL